MTGANGAMNWGPWADGWPGDIDHPRPPYLALYRPTKTTFLPGHRVQWRDGSGVTGVVTEVRLPCCAVRWEDAVNEEHVTHTGNLLHLPRQRGQQ